MSIYGGKDDVGDIHSAVTEVLVKGAYSKEYTTIFIELFPLPQTWILLESQRTGLGNWGQTAVSLSCTL